MKRWSIFSCFRVFMFFPAATFAHCAAAFSVCAVGEGGRLGPEWAMPLGAFAPHPFSRAELGKVIGSSEFGAKAKLELQKASGNLRIKIPMADGNAAALERFEEAKRRFDDFMAGRAATIKEFDEAVRPFGESQKREMIGW